LEDALKLAALGRAHLKLAMPPYLDIAAYPPRNLADSSDMP